MKIIDAYWDKINLALDTVEIEVEKEDNAEIINKLADVERKYNYIVIKIPISKMNLIHNLEKNKYNFMETQITFKKNLSIDFDIPHKFDKYRDKLRYLLIKNKIGLNDVVSNISEDLFNTDRISLDPEFNSRQSSIRYKNWIKKEYKKNELYEIVYCSKKIGFFMIKYINVDVMDPVLASLYTRYKNFGLGFSIIELPIKVAIEKGVKFIETKVSSNNLSVVKLYIEYKYSIVNINYVLRKIIKNGKIF